MSREKIIVREPLLDAKQQVIAYELACQHDVDGMASDADLQGLAALASTLNDPDAGWLLGSQKLFLESTPDLLCSEELQALRPENTVLTLSIADLADSDTSAAVQSLRGQGFGFSLRECETLAQAKPLLAHVSHIELNGAHANLPAWAALANSVKQPGTRLVARAVTSWQQVDACCQLGLDTFFGKVYLAPQPGTPGKGMNPAQAIILQLMDLVRKNADVRELEGVLKRDAAISFKLFRYINSVGFGLGTEIQSLRHAVSMLGYSTLYRWLSLLLATASSVRYGAVLMQTAVVRGRFAELLGQGLLPKSEAENLFVVGMFSLLDRLLGIPMEQVLEQVPLPEPVQQALLSREGVYGPFLALAEACESADGKAQEQADALFINARQVNEAHLAALAWAQSLKL